MNSEYLCMGIESTAHTFGVSIMDSEGNILSDVKSVYKPPAGSGIHPREASRHHTVTAPDLINEAMEKASISYSDIGIIAYSAGPGIGPCLRVGATVSRALSLRLKKPLIPVNNAIGHIELACLTSGVKDPVNLLVSGGHTMINSFNTGKWRVFGETLDLTIGQLIDQIGRYAGFSSPAGAIMEELARKSKNYLMLPYSVKGNDVSFSGILTSAKKLLDNDNKIEDVSYSLQETAYSMLTEVTERALAFLEKEEVLISGGVAASSRLKEMLDSMCKERGAKCFTVPNEFNVDNGLMIAWQGILQYKTGTRMKIKDTQIMPYQRTDDIKVNWI